MSFNKLTESIVTDYNLGSIKQEGARGRAPNPEIAKLVDSGMPYWKARALVRKNGGTAPDVSSSPTPTSNPAPKPAHRAGTEKTQEAIDSFVKGYPQATVEDVVAHLNILNAGPNDIRTGYITDPQAVKEMLDISKDVASPTPEIDDVPTSELDREKEEKYQRLRKFMKMNRQERDNYLNKAKSSSGIVDDEDVDDEEEEEVDPFAIDYVKSMKPRRYADDDEENLY